MSYGQLVVINYIENNNFKRCDFAKKIGVSNATLSNYLNGKRHLPFEVSLLIQKIFLKGNADYIKRTCLDYDKMEHIRPALEYLSLNFYIDELGKLLNKIKEFHNFEELYSVYNFIYNYQCRTKSYSELLKDLKILYKEVKSDDLIALLTTVEANIYSLTREYKSLFRLAIDSEEMVEELPESFTKKSFKVRLYEVLAQAYLFNKNDIEKARYYANLIFSMKTCAKSEAYASYIVGTSYLFHNYAESYYHLSKSAKMYESLGLFDHQSIVEKQNIKMLENFWEIKLDELSDDLDESEKAHRLAKSGNTSSTLSILDGLQDSAFRTYYRALALDDDSLHFKALGIFMKEGDIFYARLPILELEKKENYKGIIKNLL